MMGIGGDGGERSPAFSSTARANTDPETSATIEMPGFFSKLGQKKTQNLILKPLAMVSFVIRMEVTSRRLAIKIPGTRLGSDWLNKVIR
jgi:hypothetical protein